MGGLRDCPCFYRDPAYSCSMNAGAGIVRAEPTAPYRASRHLGVVWSPV